MTAMNNVVIILRMSLAQQTGNKQEVISVSSALTSQPCNARGQVGDDQLHACGFIQEENANEHSLPDSSSLPSGNTQHVIDTKLYSST